MSVVTVAGIVVVVFFIMRVLPGDAAAVRASSYASEEKLEQIREQLGLSDPVPVQFVNYVRDVISGDLATVPPASCTLWRKRVPALLEVRGLRKTFGRGRGALPRFGGGGGGGWIWMWSEERPWESWANQAAARPRWPGWWQASPG